MNHIHVNRKFLLSLWGSANCLQELHDANKANMLIKLNYRPTIDNGFRQDKAIFGDAVYDNDRRHD